MNKISRRNFLKVAGAGAAAMGLAACGEQFFLFECSCIFHCCKCGR